MAISYSLAWAAPAAVEQLVDGLLGLGRPPGLLPAEATPDDLTGDGVVLRAGMWCRAGAARPRDVPWPDPLEADFAVEKACWAVFRENGDGDRDAQRDEMVWLIAGLLAHLPGDAALHYQYEVLWLVRKAGRLVVNERDDIWTPERLAFLPSPYERASLGFSEV